MFCKYLNNSSNLFFLLALFGFSHAQAASLVTTSQNGDAINWQVSGATFPIDKIILKVNGPDQGSVTIPTGCTTDPLICALEFAASTSPTFSTLGLAGGSYSWETEIVPMVLDTGVCDSQVVVRQNQGGSQGLDGGTALSPEELYIECVRNNNLLPPADQQLIDSGSFAIGLSGSVAVPPSTPPTPGQPDNQPPVAQCQDFVIEGGLPNCSHNADINNGSFDPDGTLVSIVQTPAGPYTLGLNDVSLTVTDNLGASNSCSALVVITDSQAPSIQCSANNITPPEAPVTFSAGSSDYCSVPVTEVVSYDCYKFTKKGKRVDKTDSCVVTMSGANITIEETSGVGSFIDWTVQSTDSVGNQSSELCSIEITNPGKGNK